MPRTWTTSGTGVFGVLQDTGGPGSGREVLFEGPGSGNRGATSRGINGQIIPPNRGQYPRGRSLPGLGRFPYGAAQRRALLQLARRGLLGRAAMAQLLLELSAEWWFQTETTSLPPTPGQLPKGYTEVCTAPVQTCGFSGTATAWGTGGDPATQCSVIQTTCVNWPLFRTDAQLVAINPPPNTIAWGYRRALFTDNVVKLATKNPGTPFPLVWETRRTRTTPQPIPMPSESELTYPRTRTRPGGARQYPGGRPVRVRMRPPVEEEKKVLLLTNGRLGKLYGKLTEFEDTMDCMKSAMGDSPKTNPCFNARTFLEKVNCIARNHRKIDWGHFAECMVVSNAKDMAIGKAVGLADRIARDRYWRRPVGPTSGWWSHPRAPSMSRM